MFIKLCNLGRDAELRYTPAGKAVANLALAYSVGYGDSKRTQWLDGSLWGDRAEKLAPHLTKGKQVLIYADDLEVETYTTKDSGEQRSKLKCRISQIEFTNTPGERDAGSPSLAQPSAHGQPGGFDGFDDTIPF